MRTFIISLSLAALLTPAAHAGSGAGLAGPFYASAETCSQVLGRLRAVRHAEARAVAAEICGVSRLADGLASGTGVLAEAGEYTRSVRPRATGDDQIDFAAAVAQRNSTIKKFVQSDPHEANDLLKRLLGPGNDTKS